MGLAVIPTDGPFFPIGCDSSTRAFDAMLGMTVLWSLSVVRFLDLSLGADRPVTHKVELAT